MRVSCRRCGTTGPFSAIRHIAQTCDLIDDNGFLNVYGVEWEYANPLNGQWLNCGSCGHSWRTSRELPF